MADKPRKTAQERAQEAVDLSQRKVNKLTERRDNLQRILEAVHDSLAAEERLLDFAKSHPALTQETAPAAPVTDADVQPEAPAAGQHDLF
jgi:hypothetical protein